MKTTDIIRRAGRNLRRAKLRTLFTSLAIAVGAFTIMMSLAAGEGTRQYTDNLIQSNIDPQALFIVKDPSLFESGPGASTGLTEFSGDNMNVTTAGGSQADIKPLTDKDIDNIKARDDIDSILPIYQLTIQSLEFEGVDALYRGEVTVYDPDVLREVDAGELPARGTDIADDQVVIPESYAGELGLSADELVGREMTLTIAKPNQQPSDEEIAQLLASDADPRELAEQFAGETREIKLTIAAVTKQSSMSFSSPTSSMVSATTARQINNYTTEGTDLSGKYFGMTAKVASGDDPMAVAEQLRDDGYGVQTVEDLQNLIFTIVNVIQLIVAGFGVLALIASVFGIVNTMYISVLERTSQIGLMRALGMRARQVSRMFRYEAAWIGLLGGVIGILLALLAVVILNPIIQDAINLGEDNYLLAFVWWQAGLLLIGLIIVAVAAGYFPARKAAKLDPIEALRTE